MSYGWIRGQRIPGGPVARRGGQVVRALEAGIAALGDAPEVVVKVDADVTMGSRYFELLLAEFAADARQAASSRTSSVTSMPSRCRNSA